MKKTLHFISIIICLFVFAGPSFATKHQVFVSDNMYSPDTLNGVMVGDTITWILQTGSMDHTVSSTTVPAGADSLDGELTVSSAAYDYIVTVAGTYPYHCNFHPGMTGVFIATAGSGIKTPAFKQDIKAYPNPVQHQAVIKISDPGFVPHGYVIYDVIGKPVSRVSSFQPQTNGAIEISTDKLKNGMYFIVLYNNERQSQVRIVKE